ncbi:hypothetical protein [Mycolicibacterium sp. F2034L]|uniref:hypothetical protein n=1 Tax=Mycolicibacterium sp. F2034L TaxID=2926422 RepID=UPI001FF6D3A3|nr:hypothetical protein [Mycolicibacterium sp. F2034L]MCK0174812.1 hypothetical protein [Mycolicibacterium sp. F2034L]
MTIPKFKVTAGPDGLNALMDLPRNGNLDVHPLAGVRGQFIPNLKTGLYPVSRNGMYLVRPIDFTIDNAGKLNGTGGIELLAEVDGVGRLQWRITFEKFVLNGERVEIPDWSFMARGNGVTVPINELFSVKRTQTGQWIAEGPRAWDFLDVTADRAGALTFHREDGYEIEVNPPFGATAAAVAITTMFR